VRRHGPEGHRRNACGQHQDSGAELVADAERARRRSIVSAPGSRQARCNEDHTYVFGKLDLRFLAVLQMIKLTASVSFMQAATSRTSRVFYELAAEHGGYFTTTEASQAGISHRQLSYHVASGTLERVTHGVYRLIDYPAHPRGDMIAATLWAGPDSAISHESALAVYGLASAMPSAIHLTAPASFQGRRAGVRIHREELGHDERRLWDDVPVTTVERTLIDITRSSDRSLLREAVSEFLERGLTTRKRLAHAITGREDTARIRRDLGIRLPAVRESA